MFARLELVPRDILEHIAFLVALSPSETVFKPLQELLNLLLSSSTLYYSLCTTSAPHLYARVFRSTFDLDTSEPWNTDVYQFTDSRLTAELVSRYRLLRRVRRRDFADKMMREDLCVAMRVVIESNGANEAHLRSVEFPDFIFCYAEQCLNEYQLRSTSAPSYNIDLALWLLVLTWSKDAIANVSEETRERFLLLLRPLIAMTSRDDIKSTQGNTHVMPSMDDCERSDDFVYPSAISAAVILDFALREAGTTKAPPRLPLARATNATGRQDGPTMEDYYIMASYQTPLFGDDWPASRITSNPGQRRFRHDPQFFNPKLLDSNAYHRLPEFITGLWQGVYMVSCSHSSKEAPLPDAPDFICKTSLQCSLELYFSFGAQDHPVPECIGDEVIKWTAAPRDFSTQMDCLTVSGHKTSYEKYVFTAIANKCQMSTRDYSQALDCLVIGRTTEEHDRAWGGFNFAGRMKRDGSIVMKREPKKVSDANLGTWIFEGNVRYGTSFVGTWRSSILPGGIHGLFSLARPSPLLRPEV